MQIYISHGAFNQEQSDCFLYLIANFVYFGKTLFVLP